MGLLDTLNLGNRSEVTIPSYRDANDNVTAVPIKPFERLVRDLGEIRTAIEEKNEQIREFEEKAKLHLQGLHEDLERLLYRDNTQKDIIFQKIIEVFPSADKDALMEALHLAEKPSVLEQLDVVVRPPEEQ